MTRSRGRAALLVALLTVAVRVYPALALGNHGPDFETYRQMGEATLRGDDVYAVHPLFPYMPYSQLVTAICVGAGELADVPFQVLVKLVNLVRDLKLFAFGPELMGPSKLLFLLAFVVSLVVLPFATCDGRRRAALLPPLLFVGLYGGVSAQYLVWGIPLAVLARDRRLAGYTALATAAMLAHYLVYHPSILLASPPAGPTEGFLTHLVLFAGNAGLAAFCCAWAVRVAREESAAAPPAVRRALLAGALVVAALFAVLVGRGVLDARRALAVPAAAGPA